MSELISITYYIETLCDGDLDHWHRGVVYVHRLAEWWAEVESREPAQAGF